MTRARDLADSADLAFDGNTLKIDSSTNRVGIGTASPSATLDLQGGRTYLQSASGDKYVLRLTNPANVSGVFLGNPENNSLGVYTAAGSERMRICLLYTSPSPRDA